MTYDLNELSGKIEEWHYARNLVHGSKPKDQICKLIEEVGETASAVARQQDDRVKDGIGDCFVVLTLLALQHGFTIDQCVAAAYEEIKDRKGRMQDGIFVRDCE